jgi:hypothetical protein
VLEGKGVGIALGKGGLKQVRGMKVRSSVKKLCEGCKVCYALLQLEAQ